MKKRARIITLIISLILIASAIYYFGSLKMPVQVAPEDIQTLEVTDTTSMDIEAKKEQFEPAKEIVNPSGFINTDEIELKDLIGKKVILVDFWTYSCINCQRTLPYLTAWYEKYKDQGFEIVGIHTPEFEFEKDYDNVVRATEKFGVEYPVVQDNDYATWRAYGNRYWPRKYLIDIDGFIVYDHIGEGAYEETEAKIQELLGEAMERMDIEGTIDKSFVDVEGEKVASRRQSPEIYFGSQRNTHLENGIKSMPGVQSFEEPEEINTNSLYLVGEWDIQPEFAENKDAHAKIIFKYRAQKVFFVATADEEVTVTLLLDGQPLGDEAGIDVISEEGKSQIKVNQDKLYRIIEDPEGFGEHTLEMIIEDPGLQAFTFTFG